MKDIAKFIAGFERFQEKYFGPDRELFDQLRHAQRPQTLVIACCDSRVDPAILTGADPGDMFVVRNVANLVPPYETGAQFPGMGAALEFAVQGLKVEHIIVLGHSGCGGIQALLRGSDDSEFMARWMGIAQRARSQVLAKLPDKSPPLHARACEQAALLISLENLLTFPWIRQRVEAGSLHLHGWYFDIGQGELLGYSPHSTAFEQLASPPMEAD